MSDDLTLTTGGKSFSGWTEVEVELSCDRCPNSFRVAITEKSPFADEVTIRPNDTCEVKLGDDKVITGYVDDYAPSFTPSEHRVEVRGRGKCRDLVDCSAEWEGCQIVSSTALQILQKLAKPYGISVTASADVGSQVDSFNILIGETPYEIADRIGRWEAFLAYEQPDGNLILNQAGSDSMASGIEEGVNVERASAIYSMAERYSHYRGFLNNLDTLAQLVDHGGNLVVTSSDKAVQWHRQLDVIVEAGRGYGNDVAKRRIDWEANRRAGRGTRLEVTVDGWRDSKGKLWTPNAKIPVKLPTLKAPDTDWVIGSVRFLKNEEGTHAELVLMPRFAFLPQPSLLQLMLPQFDAK